MWPGGGGRESSWAVLKAGSVDGAERGSFLGCVSARMADVGMEEEQGEVEGD